MAAQDITPGDRHAQPFVVWLALGLASRRTQPSSLRPLAPDKFIHIHNFHSSLFTEAPNLPPVPTSCRKPPDLFSAGRSQDPANSKCSTHNSLSSPISTLQTAFDAPVSSPYPIHHSISWLHTSLIHCQPQGVVLWTVPWALLLRGAPQIMQLLRSQAPPSLHWPGRHVTQCLGNIQVATGFSCPLLPGGRLGIICGPPRWR